MPKDFLGLSELIEIFERRGCLENAWPLIEENLNCGPVSLGEIATRAGVSVGDFRIGFRHERLFHLFRQKHPIEDQFIEMHRHGLHPNKAALAAIHFATMVPFGVLAEQIAVAQKEGFRNGSNGYFAEVFHRISALFIAFGSHWLSEEMPESIDERIRLLSLAWCISRMSSWRKHLGSLDSSLATTKYQARLFPRNTGKSGATSLKSMPWNFSSVSQWVGESPNHEVIFLT